jgi:hypothetical protein
MKRRLRFSPSAADDAFLIAPGAKSDYRQRSS